jgi:hypothetical protein
MKMDEKIQDEKDSLGGGQFSPLESGLYKVLIKNAYVTISAGGATAINLVLQTEDGKEIRDQQWVTSGTAKGCTNTYKVKNKDGAETGEEAYLPGFSNINSLCFLTLNKNFPEMETENKTIMLYDYTSKTDVPTEVPVLTELLGKTVVAGIVKETVDKMAKNDQTGKYEPTGKVYDKNAITKYFRADDMMTTTELKSGAEKAEFHESWSKTWTGKTVDRSTAKQATGTKGTPATGAAAAKTSLFA